MTSMGSAKAHEARVRNGRLVLDEPSDLPDGTVVSLFEDVEDYADPGDDLDDAERERLHASLRRGLAQARAGKTRPVEEFLAELKEP